MCFTLASDSYNLPVDLRVPTKYGAKLKDMDFFFFFFFSTDSMLSSLRCLDIHSEDPGFSILVTYQMNIHPEGVGD